MSVFVNIDRDNALLVGLVFPQQSFECKRHDRANRCHFVVVLQGFGRLRDLSIFSPVVLPLAKTLCFESVAMHQEAVCIFLIDTHKNGTRIPVAGAPAKSLVGPLLTTIEAATRGVAATVSDSARSSCLAVSLLALQALQLGGSFKSLVNALYALLEAFDLEAETQKTTPTMSGEATKLVRVLRAVTLETWTTTNEHDKTALKAMGLRVLALGREHPSCPHTLESVRRMLEAARLPESELQASEDSQLLLPALRRQLCSSSASLRKASLGLLVILYGDKTLGQKQLAACYEVEGMEKTVENGRHMTSKLRDVSHTLLSQVSPPVSPPM